MKLVVLKKKKCNMNCPEKAAILNFDSATLGLPPPQKKSAFKSSDPRLALGFSLLIMKVASRFKDFFFPAAFEKREKKKDAVMVVTRTRLKTGNII